MIQCPVAVAGGGPRRPKTAAACTCSAPGQSASVAELERYLLDLKDDTSHLPGEREIVVEEVTRQIALLKYSAAEGIRDSKGAAGHVV